MATLPSTSPTTQATTDRGTSVDQEFEISVAAREFGAQLRRGFLQILLCTGLGLLLGIGTIWLTGRADPVATTARVVFSFPGFERGQYPDQSEFQPDDLRGSELIAEALARQELGGDAVLHATVRGGLTVEGAVPLEIVQERDRLRASGQQPAAYIPDEYIVSLSLGDDVPLNRSQREQLLADLIAIYRDRFQRTHGEIPAAFGRAFEALEQADVSEYELILRTEIANIAAYLQEQTEYARSFRSAATNFSFADLLERTEFFAQIRLNEALGLIYQNGLSRDRELTMSKMDYHLQLLESREARALAEESVVNGLLQQAQQRGTNPVMATASASNQTTGETQVLDQGLIDSLLANDSYNFLVREALEAGLRTKEVQADKARLLELRDNMRTFVDRGAAEQSAAMAQAEDSFKALKAAYDDLIEAIRETFRDYAQQRLGDAVRISRAPVTETNSRKLMLGGVAGGGIGFSLGAGLALLGIVVAAGRQSR